MCCWRIFGQFFVLGGMMDDFFGCKFSVLVDVGINFWSFWFIGDGIKLVLLVVLVDFQCVVCVCEVFFCGGGKVLVFCVDICVLEFGDGLKELMLDIDGQVIKFIVGNSMLVSLQWLGQ